MKHYTAYLSALFLVCITSFGVSAKQTYDFSLPAPAIAGVYIENLATGDVVVDINGDRPFVPASITKALTSASVLTGLERAFRFETPVLVDGEIRGGKANGNIVVRISGDPTLESAYFEDYAGFADSIVSALRRLDVTHITGGIVIDKGGFVDQAPPGGWMEEDLAWPYGTGHRAVNFRDNRMVLTMPSKKTVPVVPGLKVKHTNAKGALKVYRKRNSSTILTRGNVRRKPKSVMLANPDPEAALRHELSQKLDSAGISLGKVTNAGKRHNIMSHLYTHVSPPLPDILRSLMFRSDNMMAEGVLRQLAPGKSREQAVAAELKMWEHRDIDTELIRLEDGSGLSRNDRLTPYFLADVLVWMASHYRAPEYVALFPKAGVEGTLKSFLRDTALEGKVALKTGSMKGVQSYAGYVLGNDGFPTHVVVFMINNFNCSRAKVKSAAEQLLLDIFAVE